MTRTEQKSKILPYNISFVDFVISKRIIQTVAFLYGLYGLTCHTRNNTSTVVHTFNMATGSDVELK